MLPSIDVSLPLSSDLASPLSPLKPLPELSKSMDADDALPFSDAVVNLVIAEQAHLAIRCNTCRDPGSPGYDMGIPPSHL